MKRLIALLMAGVIAVTLFCGCNTSENTGVQSSDAYNYLTDTIMAKSNIWASNVNVAKCETGYYTLIGKKIYYVEKSTMEGTPLCNKPNCLHTDESCNAHIGVVADNIFYSEGYIYYIVDAGPEKEFIGSYLKRISADGSNAETILYMELYPTDWLIHRGAFYYSIKKYYYDEATGLESSSNADNYIYMLTLDGKSEPRQIYYAEEVYKQGQIIDLMAYGDNLYFNVSGYSRDDRKMYIDKECKLNIKSEEVSEIISEDGDSLIRPAYINGKLIFLGNKRYLTDFDGNIQEELTALPEGSLYADGTYIYIDNFFGRAEEEDRIIEVYDSSYNKIDEINMGNGSAATWRFLPIDDEYFIFSGRNDTSEFIFYYDKKDFGTINGGEWERKYAYKKSLLSDENSNAPGALSDTVPNGSDTLVELWQKAKDKKYGVKDSFQADEAVVEGGFSVRLIWEQDGGTTTAYFPIMEFENEAKAQEFVKDNPFTLQKGSIVVNVGVESIPQEVYDMLSSILESEPIEPLDSKDFSGENFVFE